MSGMLCADPDGIGCKRPISPGLSLAKTPHNHKSTTPCQQCRSRRMVRERLARGQSAYANTKPGRL